MPVVRGCQFPDELLYDVENHIWIQEVADGNLKLGMTSVAVAMAGQLVAFTPKKVGRSVKAGKSCATIESGKWVGPAKSLAAAGGLLSAGRHANPCHRRRMASAVARRCPARACRRAGRRRPGRAGSGG